MISPQEIIIDVMMFGSGVCLMLFALKGMTLAVYVVLGLLFVRYALFPLIFKKKPMVVMPNRR